MTMTPEDYARFRAKATEVAGTEDADFLGAGLYDSNKFNAESINGLSSDDFLWVRCKIVSPHLTDSVGLQDADYIRERNGLQ